MIKGWGIAQLRHVGNGSLVVLEAMGCGGVTRSIYAANDESSWQASNALSWFGHQGPLLKYGWSRWAAAQVRLVLPHFGASSKSNEL